MGAKRFFIAAPRYGDEVVAEAYMSKNNAARNELFGEEDAVEVVYDAGCKSSLINFGFNQLLVEALNKRDEGEVDWFAMCHSDVVSPAGWLNSLYSLARERGDAVVSAVVSIKEPERQRTSCAVGDRTNRFNIKRYIKTSDRLAMPTTFRTADVAQDETDVLLINTGLWVADLSHPFWDDFAFRSIDQIMVNPTNNRRQAFCVSEDWFFSYELDRMGVPYSATWLPTRHIGPSVWSSHEIPAASSS